MITLITERELWELTLFWRSSPWWRQDGDLWIRNADPVPPCSALDEGGIAHEAVCMSGDGTSYACSRCCEKLHASEECCPLALVLLQGYGIQVADALEGMYQVTLAALHETQLEDCEKEFTRILQECTSFPERMRLQEEAKSVLSEDLRLASAVALKHYTALEADEPVEIGVWPLEGGGYVGLRLVGQLIHVSISIPAKGELSFGPTISGLLNPPPGIDLPYFIGRLKGLV